MLILVLATYLTLLYPSQCAPYVSPGEQEAEVDVYSQNIQDDMTGLISEIQDQTSSLLMDQYSQIENLLDEEQRRATEILDHDVKANFENALEAINNAEKIVEEVPVEGFTDLSPPTNEYVDVPTIDGVPPSEVGSDIGNSLSGLEDLFNSATDNTDNSIVPSTDYLPPDNSVDPNLEAENEYTTNGETPVDETYNPDDNLIDTPIDTYLPPSDDTTVSDTATDYGNPGYDNTDPIFDQVRESSSPSESIDNYNSDLNLVDSNILDDGSWSTFSEDLTPTNDGETTYSDFGSNTEDPDYKPELDPATDYSNVDRADTGTDNAVEGSGTYYPNEAIPADDGTFIEEDPYYDDTDISDTPIDESYYPDLGTPDEPAYGNDVQEPDVIHAGVGGTRSEGPYEGRPEPGYNDIGSFFQSFGDKVTEWTNKLSTTFTDLYNDVKKNLPVWYEHLQNTLQNFSVMVQKGCQSVAQRIVLLFDDAKAKEIVERLEKYLNEGSELVDGFFQKCGEKLALWEKEQGDVDSGLLQTQVDNHHVDQHYPDLFKDEEIRKDLEKMVTEGILSQEEVNILTDGAPKKENELKYMAIRFPTPESYEKQHLPIGPQIYFPDSNPPSETPAGDDIYSQKRNDY